MAIALVVLSRARAAKLSNLAWVCFEELVESVDCRCLKLFDGRLGEVLTGGEFGLLVDTEAGAGE